MHTKHQNIAVVKLYGRDVEIHLWECVAASTYMCMFCTLDTNFQDGSWIYRLMDFKSRRDAKKCSLKLVCIRNILRFSLDLQRIGLIHYC